MNINDFSKRRQKGFTVNGITILMLLVILTMLLSGSLKQSINDMDNHLLPVATVTNGYSLQEGSKLTTSFI